MKKELDPRIFFAVVAVLVVIIGVIAWRQFAPSTKATLTPQEAGMGKPMYPVTQAPNQQNTPTQPNTDTGAK